MSDVHSLDRAQLRALAHPLRHRILQLLCGHELSATQLAERIEEAPTNLYYHVDRLREAGLIELTRTTPVRGTVEKFYRAVASRFTVPPSLLRIGEDAAAADGLLPAVETMAESALAQFASSVRRGLIGSGEGQAMPAVNSLVVRTTPARIEHLQNLMTSWIHELQAEADGEGEETVEYALFNLFFLSGGSAPSKARGKSASRKRRQRGQ